MKTANKRSQHDARIMSRALELARRGLHTARPNPCVGCVVVRRGEVVAEGWHRARGEPHAETLAIRAAGDPPPEGLEFHVTLEPCAHHGRTPPCAQQIAALRPARVVVAMRDPNPLVNGKGISLLEGAGVDVMVGVRQDEALWLNRGHVKRMESGRPWVVLKVASTLDGKTALAAGLSKWITSAASRRDAQDTRAQSCAILTGIGTAELDNPRLTVREFAVESDPLKVLVDSKLRADPGLEMFRSGRTLLATAAPPPDAGKYPEGVEFARLPDGAGRVDLGALLDLLGERECNRVLVEAGARLNGAFLSEGLADEVHVYWAPAVFSRGRGLFDMAPPETPSAARRFALRETAAIGDDVKAIYLAQGR